MHFNFRGKKRGFSLLEIMIAVAIFATSLIFILPSIKKSENQIKKNLRTLQALNHTLYSHSRIQNKVYRLAFKTHLQKSSYWVEVKTTNPPFPHDEKPPDENQRPDPNPKKGSSPFFKQDTQILQTKKLPEGLYFEWDGQDNESDTLYITYDPHFITHQIRIFLKKENNFTWTLSFNPVLGELEILEGEHESS